MKLRLSIIKGLLLIGLLFLGISSASAQQKNKRSSGNNWYGLSIRNNLAYDATGTPNLGLEVALSKRFTLGVDGSFKPWPRFLFWDMDTKTNPMQWRHFMVDAELRFYPKQAFSKWFVGVGAVYMHYNVGAIPLPRRLFPSFRDERYQGDFVGGTLFGGYSWWLGKHWRIEVEAGAALGYAMYDRFDCPHCGTMLGHENRFAVLPKIGLNFAYNPVARKDQSAKSQKKAQPQKKAQSPKVKGK